MEINRVMTGNVCQVYFGDETHFYGLTICGILYLDSWVAIVDWREPAGV